MPWGPENGWLLWLFNQRPAGPTTEWQQGSYGFSTKTSWRLSETMLRKLGPIQEDWSREVGLLELGGEAKEGKGLSNPAGWRVVETKQKDLRNLEVSSGLWRELSKMWLGCWDKAEEYKKTDGFKDGSFLDRPTTWPNQEDRLKDIENHLVGARSCPRRLIEGKLGCWDQAVGERRPVTGTQLCSRLIRAWPQTAGVARELKHKVDHDNGFGIFACWSLDKLSHSSEDFYTQKCKRFKRYIILIMHLPLLHFVPGIPQNNLVICTIFRSEILLTSFEAPCETQSWYMKYIWKQTIPVKILYCWKECSCFNLFLCFSLGICIFEDYRRHWIWTQTIWPSAEYTIWMQTGWWESIEYIWVYVSLYCISFEYNWV